LTPLKGQNSRVLQNTFLEAEYFFFNEDYADALPFYMDLYEKDSDNANIAFRIGCCYLNIEGQKNLSIEYLEKATSDMSAKHREGSISQKSAPYEALFELGRSYLINNMFDKAIYAFASYSETLLPEDLENIAFINQQIKACENAKKLIETPIHFSEENLGELINDDKDNFNPVVSYDGKTLAFMVSLKFYDAIMVSRLKNNKWGAPANITPDLETDGDMYISSLSEDGNVLYLSKDDDYDSDIYMSRFDGTKWLPVEKLNKNINTKYWESHGYVSSDGSMFIFASDRPGGYGGLDLYISRKINGDWGAASNLGPEINTPFNEDRPFLLEDSETLYFSSQGHEGMGGYDVFISILGSNGLWSAPVNLGYPLNNTDDNIFFMPTNKGKMGYISLQRNNTGFGGEDIYEITIEN
jgi:hypothetical protein